MCSCVCSLAGMSKSLFFQVFYGTGQIRYGPEGVDLSDFRCATEEVPRARERSWGSILNWLFRAFGLNREKYEISVMAVVRYRMEVIY